MNNKLIVGLLISATTVAVQTASAADIPVKAAPPVVVVSVPGWFGYIEGRYLLKDRYGVLHTDAGGNAGPAFLDEGWGGAGRLGYRFNATWDVAVAASYGDYRPGPFVSNLSRIQPTDAKLTTVDGQIGYNLGGGGQTGRFYAGVRYVEWKHVLVDPPTANGFRWDGKTQGIGAVGGMDFTATLAGPLSAIGGFEGSVLAGTIRDQVTDDPPGGINTFGGSRDRHRVHLPVRRLSRGRLHVCARMSNAGGRLSRQPVGEPPVPGPVAHKWRRGRRGWKRVHQSSGPRPVRSPDVRSRRTLATTAERPVSF